MDPMAIPLVMLLPGVPLFFAVMVMLVMFALVSVHMTHARLTCAVPEKNAPLPINVLLKPLFTKISALNIDG